MISAYAADNNATRPALADCVDAGGPGVTTDNLAAVNAAIDAATGAEANTVGEIQGIVDNVTDAISLISAYAADNTATTPTLADYAVAGVTGVTTDNLAAVNAAIDAATGADADTVGEIQGIVDGVTDAISLISA
ncbi:MAG: hypothetical protein GY829_06630, partial [Gammaproteobacteria bacterium]|nr:hypothetical protein [Gammaproteobacteria bacterium]